MSSNIAEIFSREKDNVNSLHASDTLLYEKYGFNNSTHNSIYILNNYLLQFDIYSQAKKKNDFLKR